MSINALIVESERSNREMLARMLTGIGVKCIVCETENEALKLDSGRRYDFIIVSRQLKDIGAELFLVRFREHHYIDDSLTIMLSTEAVEEIYYEANKAGYKLVFNEKDSAEIERFLLEAINHRTIDLKARILYVEDSRSVSLQTSVVLKRYRALVTAVESVAEAVEKFKESEFDLIITDYYLNSGETGDDLISFVRDFDDFAKAHTPILVVSAEMSQSKRTSFLRNGADDYINKPYDNGELIARASNLIAHNKLFRQFLKQQQELLNLAMSDQLTGLYNRHSLFDVGPKYISDALRHEYSVSLLVIDVDHFKLVNDNYGHAKGDRVLKKISEVMQTSCRNGDLVARFGGEEFVILLTHCPQQCAMIKAEKLCLDVIKNSLDDLEITVSIGVAELKPGDDFEGLFSKADAALYQAKSTGRNCAVQFSEEMTNS